MDCSSVWTNNQQNPGEGATLVHPCLGDLNGDGVVDIFDLLTLLAAWGRGPDPADLNCDESVGILDLLALLAGWGPCPGTGGVAGASFEEELANAGLSQADWDAFKECMTTGTKAEQDNCLCWMIHYLEGCPRELCTPPNCPGADPFSNPPVPHVS